MHKKIIAVAGGTGNLGGRIVKALLKKGAGVSVLVRKESNSQKTFELERLGAKCVKVDMSSAKEISVACTGADCIISALAGLHDVVITVQKQLLNGAVIAGVPRFIPSDFSLDFTRFRDGENRNLDLRREFHNYLDVSPIAATSIFNGAFMDMLTKEIPMIIFKRKLVLYWGDAEHKMAFTTMDDTAEYTANAAMDSSTPRYLRIAGDQVSPHDIRKIMDGVTGEKYRMLKTGGPGLLSMIIKVTKLLSPGKTDLYPAWQGMQYMRNMIDERANLESTDNNRYEGMKWSTVKELISRLPVTKLHTQ